MRSKMRAGFMVVLGCALLAPAASGEEGAPAEAAEAAPQREGSAGRAPMVDLGRLLKLPDSYEKPVESRRGKGQADWERRFETVRLDLVSAKTALAAAKAELGEAATDSSQWAVAAPGTAPNPENTPLSYKLRQEIRRQRENVKRSERQLRSLEIEADLADVPAEWRATHIGSGPEGGNELPADGEVDQTP